MVNGGDMQRYKSYSILVSIYYKFVLLSLGQVCPQVDTFLLAVRLFSRRFWPSCWRSPSRLVFLDCFERDAIRRAARA